MSGEATTTCPWCGEECHSSRGEESLQELLAVKSSRDWRVGAEERWRELTQKHKIYLKTAFSVNKLIATS